MLSCRNQQPTTPLKRRRAALRTHQQLVYTSHPVQKALAGRRLTINISGTIPNRRIWRRFWYAVPVNNQHAKTSNVYVQADLMKQQTAALQHRKAVAATNPSTLSTALGKMDQTVEKEWELVQDNSLQADYLMLWPVSTSEDKEWEVVRADSVEERM